MRKIILLLSFISSVVGNAKTIDLKSPSGEIRVSVNIADKIYYTVYGGNEILLDKNSIGLNLRDTSLGANPQIISRQISSVQQIVKPVVALKFSEIHNNYNLLTIKFKGEYSVEFRAYNDGVSYRFVTSLQREVEVVSEDLILNFPSDYVAHIQQPNALFISPYEEQYSHIQTKDWLPTDSMSLLPVLIDTQRGYKILLGETDLFDYPCMFLSGTGANGMRSVFPNIPIDFGRNANRKMIVTKEKDYIAKTWGTRSYPWRFFVIVKNDGQLIENTMTAKLSCPSMIEDTSWIKPGQVSWEWWNGATPYGPDVNFVSGFNTETYKYFIDFAAKFGIPYLLMDEGWAINRDDPYTTSANVDVHEVIRYAKTKGVDVLLWVTWFAVNNHNDLFDVFSSWGVAGVKIDFMDRSDQLMMNFYERVAKSAAEHKMLVSFHGSITPKGLEYRYPNVISYEGIRGMEKMDNCQPVNSLWFPYIRNVVGAADYTPGAMISMQPDLYVSKRPNAASIGTRAYQMAVFIVVESGLQMLADNPTLYYRESECTEFITKIPVTWDETLALAASAGEYAVVAKRKGDKWYVGAMNGSNNVAGREITISLDFLSDGKSYNATSFEDGINASRQAMDYRKRSSSVCSKDSMIIKMARNGGWVAVIE